MRLARICLEEIGMSQDLLRHGIERELYAVSLAKNLKEFLRGVDTLPEFYDMPMNYIVDFFKNRWMERRASRKPDYVNLNRTAVLNQIYSASKPHQS